MYDATETSPTENIDLLGQHFCTQHFEGMAHVPSYIRWWLGCDMVPAYRHHERVLKLLQWRCPPTRWHLKSPPDLCCLDAFVAVYPDARIVWTHRDPAKVLASVCKLISIVSGFQTDDVDPHELGREQLALWSEGVRRERSRSESGVGEARFADVFMHDLVARSDRHRRRDLRSHRPSLHRPRRARHARVGRRATAAPARRPRRTRSRSSGSRSTVRDAFRDYTEHFALRLEA